MTTLASDAPGSSGSWRKSLATRGAIHTCRKNFPFLWRHCRFFPCTFHRFTMLKGTSRGLATAGLFSVVPRFVVHFLSPPQSQFVPSPLLVILLPTVCVQCGNGRSEGIQLTDGLDLVATHCGKNFSGAVHLQSRARVRTQTAHRHMLRVAAAAPTSGRHVSSIKNHQKLCSPPACGGPVA